MTLEGRVPAKAGYAAVLALLAVCIYANAMANEFAHDDIAAIVNNERAHGVARLPDGLSSPYWPHRRPGSGLYRPVTVAIWAVEWDVWRGDAAGFHAVNVATHAAVTVLTFLLLLEMGAATAGAVAGAAVFAVHPVHVEAVANVVGGSELFAAFFVLLAVYAYLRRSWRPWPRALAVSGCWLLALGSKEHAVMLPALLLLVEAVRPASVAPLRRRVGHEWRLLLMGMVVGLGYLAVRTAVLGTVAGSGVAPFLGDLSTGERILTAIRLWPEYLRLILWPRDLVADYSPAVIFPVHGFGPLVAAGLLTAVAAIAATLVAWERAPLVAAGVLWFAIALFPVSNLVVPIGTILAERTLYLPSVGIALVVGGVVEATRARAGRPAEALGALALVAVLGLAGWRTWTRTPTWHDSSTVLNVLIDEHPESFRAQWALGQMLRDRGDLDASLAHLRRAADLVPGHYVVHADLSGVLFALGRYGEAAAVLERLATTDPRQPDVQVLLGLSLLRSGRDADAADAMARATDALPENGRVRGVYASALAAQGRWDQALSARQESIRLLGADVPWQDWVALARIHLELGHHDAAGRALDRARAAAPQPDAVPDLEQLRP